MVVGIVKCVFRQPLRLGLRDMVIQRGTLQNLWQQIETVSKPKEVPLPSQWRDYFR